jgi:hypothetical protein
MVLFAFNLREDLRHAWMHTFPPLANQGVQGFLLDAFDLMHVVDTVLDELGQL